MCNGPESAISPWNQFLFGRELDLSGAALLWLSAVHGQLRPCRARVVFVELLRRQSRAYREMRWGEP